MFHIRLRDRAFYKQIGALSLLCCIPGLIGCGSGNHLPNTSSAGGGLNGTPAITLALSSSSILDGTSTQCIAQVSGTDTSAIDWKVNGIAGGSGAVGIISTSGLYTAPANVNAVFTITATLHSDSSVTSSVTVQVTSPAPKPVPVITLALTSASILGGTNTQCSAQVSGATSGNVNWQVNGIAGGNGVVGTITSSGLYTAPANANALFTITATLQSDSTVSSSASVQVTSPVPTNGKISFAFTLPATAQTSAGVYDSHQKLVRTLWSNTTYSSGVHTQTWDGLDNVGSPVPPDQFTIKVLSNNVTYAWGVIGNTSRSPTAAKSWDTQSSF